MASGDQLVIAANPSVGPLSGGYVTTAAQSIEVTSGVATFNGSGAASDFVPALSFYDPNGNLLARAVAQSTVTTGTSSEVSFFPFVFASSTTTPAGALSVTDGITTVTPTTNLDFTSGATVTSGGAGIANVAISGGGFVPNAAVGQYSVAAVSIASNGSSNGSFVYGFGAALLNLTTPTLPTVTTRGVYAMMASFQGDAAFTEGYALWGHAYMNGGTGAEGFQAPQTQSPTIGPLGTITVVCPMNAGDSLGVTLTNRDTSSRFCEWKGITIVRIFQY